MIAPETGFPNTLDSPMASIKKAVIFARCCCGKPIAQVQNDAGKEARFGHSQQNAKSVERPLIRHKHRAAGDKSPTDHDPSNPFPRTEAMQQQVAWHFKERDTRDKRCRNPD